MIYIQAICQTLTSVGPCYMINTYNWVKCAVWDAPKRLILDIELEKMMIERNLSKREKELNSSDSE
jgi:hypothetical protein